MALTDYTNTMTFSSNAPKTLSVLITAIATQDGIAIEFASIPGNLSIDDTLLILASATEKLQQALALSKAHAQAEADKAAADAPDMPVASPDAQDAPPATDVPAEATPAQDGTLATA